MTLITIIAVLAMFISGMFLFASSFALDATEKENNWSEYHVIKHDMKRAGFIFAISFGVFILLILWQAVYS